MRTRWVVLRRRVPFVLALVLVAFALRAVAAVVVERLLFAVGRNGFLGADDVGYDHIAWAQAQAWRGAGPPLGPSDYYLLHAYTYTEAVVYFLLGHHPLAMKLLNCAFSALTAGVIYLLTQSLFDRVAACVRDAWKKDWPSSAAEKGITTGCFSIVEKYVRGLQYVKSGHSALFGRTSRGYTGGPSSQSIAAGGEGWN